MPRGLLSGSGGPSCDRPGSGRISLLGQGWTTQRPPSGAQRWRTAGGGGPGVRRTTFPVVGCIREVASPPAADLTVASESPSLDMGNGCSVQGSKTEFLKTSTLCVESAYAMSIEGSCDKRPGATVSGGEAHISPASPLSPLVITLGQRVMNGGGLRRG